MSDARMPAISVVLPVYNGAAFVERAVASVLAQTFLDWELLAVDDSSTDSSHEVLTRLAATDPRVRVFRHPANAGLAAARNTALRVARGETVAYLDHDDEFYPDHLQRALDWRGRGDVLVFGYDLVEERPGHPDRGKVVPYDPAPHHARLMHERIVEPLGVAHRRDLLGRAGYFDEALRRDADSDLWRRFARAGASFTFVPARSGRHPVRSDSPSRTNPPPPPPAGDLPTPLVGVDVSLRGEQHRLRMPRGEAWLARSVFEKHEYGGIPPGALRTPPVVLDVGANVGTFALYAKLYYHRDAVVHCFEPYPPCVELLKENLSGFTDIHVYPAALGGKDGEGELLLDRTSTVAHSLHPGRVPTPAGRVAVRVRDAGAAWDEVGLGEVDVLKVDAEGSEVEILQSLGWRLGRSRVVFVEYHRRQDRRRIDALLPGHDLIGAVFHTPDIAVLKYLRADLLPGGPAAE